MRGSEANDAFEVKDGHVALRTNHCGGILGGVSTGSPIVVRIAFKPTPSISLEQDSVDLATMKPTKLTVHGRHDRCVAFRGAVAAEAAMAIVLDEMLQEAGQ
jgi:chorismate synthase